VTLLEGFGGLRGDATEQSVFNARSFYVDDLRPGTGYRFEGNLGRGAARRCGQWIRVA